MSSTSSSTCSSRTSAGSTASAASRTSRPGSPSRSTTTSRTTVEPDAAGGIRRASVRRLRRRSVAPGVELHAHLRHALRHAAVPRHAAREPARAIDFGFSTDVTPAPKMYSPRAGFNWDLSNGGDEAVADSRRHRHLRRPDAVRLAVESVQQHRRRLHGARGAVQRGEPHSVRGRPERAADRRWRHRRQPDDQLHRSRLPVSDRRPRQPRLRPRARRFRADRDRRTAVREQSQGHQVPESELSCRSPRAATAVRSTRACCRR